MPAYLRNRELVSHISADSSVTGLESSQILQAADGQVVMNHSHCFVTEFLWTNITPYIMETQIRYDCWYIPESVLTKHFLTLLCNGPIILYNLEAILILGKKYLIHFIDF